MANGIRASVSLAGAFALLAVSTICSTPTRAEILSEDKRVISGYTLVFRKFNWNSQFGTILEIKKGKRRVLRRQAHGLWIFSMDKQAESFDLKPSDPVRVADLNGDGVKDVVIQEWSGGAHCCYTYDIYSLLPGGLKTIWHCDGGDGHLAIETPKKGPAVLVIEDASLAYWVTSFADAPIPKVYLRWTDGAFRVDAKRMRKPVDPQKFKECAADPNSIASAKYFVQLVYEGHADKALEVLSKLSPAERKEFLKGFNENFRKSPHYSQIIALSDPRAIRRLKG